MSNGAAPDPYRRELTTEPWEIVSAWFEDSGITVGPAAKVNMADRDPVIAEKTAWLFYTWKDMFVKNPVEMPPTDLVTHTIPTWAGAVPVRAKDKLYTPRKKKWMDRVIPQMLQAWIIDQSVFPWCYRTKFVPKKNGDLRMVHVYVPMNTATFLNLYPMKRIEPILNSLMKPGYKVYFKADAANGYWAVPLAPEHTYKTAFGTHMGQFHYLFLGQGVSGAPQTCTRLKDIFFGPIPGPNSEPALDNTDIPGTFHYFMDDDLSAHKMYENQWDFAHDHYFPCMAWAGLTMTAAKRGFFLEKINPLGIVQKIEGLRPSEDKVAAIRDYPRRTNFDELNKFVWMTTYLRHFIPGRADHVQILKQAAVLESVEDWHRWDPGKLDWNGRIVRKPRRVERWE